MQRKQPPRNHSRPVHPVVASLAELFSMPGQKDKHPSPRVAVYEVTPRRQNPWGSHSVHWANGYRITMMERSYDPETKRPGCLQIQFGDGSKRHQPAAFNQIKAFLESNGYRWSAQDHAWESRWLKSGKTHAGRIHNATLRDEWIELFKRVIALEEAERGNSLSDYHRGNGVVAG